MKRNDLIRHLRRYGCHLLREGGRHSIWKNPIAKKMTAIPRHNEIKEVMVHKICKDLKISKP